MGSHPRTMCGGRSGRPVSYGSRHSPLFQSTIELANMHQSRSIAACPASRFTRHSRRERTGADTVPYRKDPLHSRCLRKRILPREHVAMRPPPRGLSPRDRRHATRRHATRRHATAAMWPVATRPSPRGTSPCDPSPCDTSPYGSLCFCFCLSRRENRCRTMSSPTCLCPPSVLLAESRRRVGYCRVTAPVCRGPVFVVPDVSVAWAAQTA